MTITDSTAFEDVRRALRCAIWKRSRRHIKGRDWLTVVPSEPRPDGLDNGQSAWIATLRLAVRILESWGYVVKEVTVEVASDWRSKDLTTNLDLLFELIATYREAGVATQCNAGEPT